MEMDIIREDISHEGNDTHNKMELTAKMNKYHIAYDGLKLEF